MDEIEFLQHLLEKIRLSPLDYSIIEDIEEHIETLTKEEEEE